VSLKRLFLLCAQTIRLGGQILKISNEGCVTKGSVLIFTVISVSKRGHLQIHDFVHSYLRAELFFDKGCFITFGTCRVITRIIMDNMKPDSIRPKTCTRTSMASLFFLLRQLIVLHLFVLQTIILMESSVFCFLLIDPVCNFTGFPF
jgi:hypothetical protein